MPCLEELHGNEHDECTIRTIRARRAAAPKRRILCRSCRISINALKSFNYILMSPSRFFVAFSSFMAPLLLTCIVEAHQEIPKTLADPQISWRLF